MQANITQDKQRSGVLNCSTTSDILAHACLWDDKARGKSPFYNEEAY